MESPFKIHIAVVGQRRLSATLHVGGYRHRGEIRGEIRACGDRRIDGDRQYPDGDRARRERRLRGACLPLFRGKGKRQSQIIRLYGADRFRGVQRPAHDGGARLLRAHSACAQNALERARRERRVPQYLLHGIAVSHPVQSRNGYLFRAGRQPHAPFIFSCFRL